MKIFQQPTERQAALMILRDYRRANVRGKLMFTPQEANAVLELAECTIESSHEDSPFVPGAHLESRRRLIAAHSGYRQRTSTRLDWVRILTVGGVGAFLGTFWGLLWMWVKKGKKG